MSSFPGGFQLSLFLYCFVTVSTLMTTLSWRCLSFLSPFLIFFSESTSWLCPFPMFQRSPKNILFSSSIGTSFGLTPFPLNSAYISFWSKPKILFCLNYSILCWYRLPLALFASILCFSSWIIIFKLFFSLCIFHLIHSICVFSSSILVLH